MRKVKAASLKINIIPVPQIVAESPVCLIKNNIGPCNHNFCMMAHKKPQYFGISIAEFYNKHEFSEFTVCRSSYGHPHIIPKNPNPGAKDGFEIFRQSMTAVTHLAGSWPLVDVVQRERVEFRFAEHIDSYPVTNYQTGKADWKQRLDVAEFAFYIGPIGNTETHEVDVNAIFELPEILKGERDLTPKDWCHCGSEGDWCGEGCYQPQNRESVLAMEKGGCNGK